MSDALEAAWNPRVSIPDPEAWFARGDAASAATRTRLGTPIELRDGDGPLMTVDVFLAAPPHPATGAPHSGRLTASGHSAPAGLVADIVVGDDEPDVCWEQAKAYGRHLGDGAEQLRRLPGLHHFSIIDALRDPDSWLTRRLITIATTGS